MITREESKIYKEIDKVLGQAIVENIETEEVEGYETIEVKQVVTRGETETDSNLIQSEETLGPITAAGCSVISPPTTSRISHSRILKCKDRQIRFIQKRALMIYHRKIFRIEIKIHLVIVIL